MNAIRRRVGAVAAGIAVVLALSGCSAIEEMLGARPTGTPDPTSTPRAADLVVRLGTLLPASGPQTTAGDSTRAAVQLAAHDVNTADLGVRIEIVEADSGSVGDAGAVAGAEVLIAAGVNAVIGPRSSAKVLEVASLFADAGVVEVSPSSTLPGLASIDDRGYFFRTVPDDTLQAVVLGRRILFDGARTVGILRSDDAYGAAIDAGLRDVFRAAGAEVVADVPLGVDDAAAVAAVVAAAPEAIVAIAQADQFPQVAIELDAAGIDWSSFYGTDASLEAMRDRLDGPLIDGAVFSSPGVLADRDLERAIVGVDPSVDLFNYAPEAYDAVILVALAALKAGSSDGSAIRDQMRAVSGLGGHLVTSFAEGAQRIREGLSVDYDGLSGPVDFTASGDTSAGFISFYRYGGANELRWTGQSFGRLDVD